MTLILADVHYNNVYHYLSMIVIVVVIVHIANI